MSEFDFENEKDPWSDVGMINLGSKASKQNPYNEPKEVAPPTKQQNPKVPKAKQGIQSPFINESDDGKKELSGFVSFEAQPKSENPNKEYNPEDELPILEELGISTERIKEKVISVITMKKIDKKSLEDSDMAGPFLIFIIFALTLILQKKTHFGYIYGTTIFGGFVISTIMNLMSKKESILLYNTISVLGYCMIPVVGASFIGVIINLKDLIGILICLLSIILSSYTATNFFEEVLMMESQKWLIFYPLVLFYTCFVILTVY